MRLLKVQAVKCAKHISSVGSRKGLRRAGASKLASVRAWVRNSKAKVVSVVNQPR